MPSVSDDDMLCLITMERWKALAADLADDAVVGLAVRLPDRFYMDTAFIVGQVAARCPRLDGGAIQDVYKSLAVGEPPPAVVLDSAMATVNALEHAIISRAHAPAADGERWLPAEAYETRDIGPDTLRRAAHDGRIQRRKVGGRNHYRDADVRQQWPHRFPPL